LEVRLKRLYLDIQFYCVVVIRYLQTQYPTQMLIGLEMRLLKGYHFFVKLWVLIPNKI